MQLVCDIGGTGIKYGISTENGDFVAGFPFTEPTPRNDLLDVISDRLSGLAGKHAVEWVGIAVAANVDGNGMVTHATNLGLSPGLPLAQTLSNRLRLPVYVENDGNTAAMAVSHLPEASGLDPIVVVTLGTGIGGGIISQGRLLRGLSGAAAELGHIMIDPRGPRCACGNRGCVEAFAGAQAVLSRHNARAPSPVAGLESLSEQVRSGDPDAMDTVTDTGTFIGRALVSVSAIIAPQAIFLTGGMAGFGDLLQHAVQAELNSHAFLRHMKRVPEVRLIEDPYLVLKGAMELNR